MSKVSIAGAILWGFEQRAKSATVNSGFVSIAGAILWGFEPTRSVQWSRRSMFQSQARFFGALSRVRVLMLLLELVVSIAGAILWGFERGRGVRAMAGDWFQSQARFFGALSRRRWSLPCALIQFQSQARFFGALSHAGARQPGQRQVSIAGAILWGFEP